MPFYGPASWNPERMKKSREGVQDAQPTTVYCLTTVQRDVRLKIQDGLETETRGDGGLYSFMQEAFKWESGNHSQELRKDSALRRNGLTA